MAPVHSSVEARDVPVVAYADLVAKKDLSIVIEEAFGYEGMGILVVSGVPELSSKRSDLLPLAFKFANLPDDIKAKCELPKAFYSFGWSHGKENLQGKPDYAKGSYYNNPETNDQTEGDQQLIAKFPSFYHPNIWPEELPELENAFMKLGQLIVDTGVLVAHQCDKLVEKKCPGYEKGKLHRIISTGKCSKARLLHYYSLSEEQIAAQKEATTLEDSFAWCGWHNDHGALTGLVQAMFTDSNGMTNRRGEILKANIPPGHLVYQIGETSQILSGGTLQATPHAVRGPQVTGVNRETLAVFMQPLPQERMAVPNGDGSKDPSEAGKTENLPKGVPPLLSRWNNDMSYDDFTQATFKAYY
ncbi:Isopenicillin N synthase-like [Phytophthora cactorum]|nr:Isopenicillin N synthase-like [Phytophthora cactorum]